MNFSCGALFLLLISLPSQVKKKYNLHNMLYFHALIMYLIII